jgi:hypothetical protein
MLIHTYHAVTMPLLCRGLEMSLSERHIRGMACVNKTRPHCVNQMGKTQSKPVAERHGRGTAEEWHGNGMVRVNPALLSTREHSLSLEASQSALKRH